MNCIRLLVATSIALGTLLFTTTSTAHAQALLNGAKSLKKLPAATSTTSTTNTTPTPDPSDRVQWGEKQDPTPPSLLLANTNTSTTTNTATHRSRSQSVPEPGTLGLLALGGLGLLRRRR
ncbi:PEP-CTERM sorting domain-containing protein [Armatimonas sp.]|uniref:PEP-CTERM sorting domain-containing protein n=1 Tax=Armatimonas sp. TaxID=1872638 RepID=UPI00286B71F7|nr:PEP-CTERM sorting domain-containing protein [Armatimonas sp.]